MKQYTAKVIDELDEYVTGELIVKGENYYIRQTSEPQNCKCGIGVFAVLKETIKEVVKTEVKEDAEQIKITNREWLNTLSDKDFYHALRRKRIQVQNFYLDTDLDLADFNEAVEYDLIAWLKSEHKAE